MLCIFGSSKQQESSLSTICDETGICHPNSGLWLFRLGSTHSLIVLSVGCLVSVGGLLQCCFWPCTSLKKNCSHPRLNAPLELLKAVHNIKHKDSCAACSNVQPVIVRTFGIKIDQTWPKPAFLKPTNPCRHTQCSWGRLNFFYWW